MLYLLLAMLICFVVPWLPVLLLRLTPVRPAPPLSAKEMERLRAQLYSKLTRPAGRSQPADQGRQAVALPRQTPRVTPPQGVSAPSVESIEDAPDAPPDNGLSHLTLRSYQWVNLVILPIFIVSMLGLAILWALLFNFLGEEHARTFPPGVFVFKPFVYWAIFGVPAIFLGIFSTAAILEPLTRILLGRRYTEYSHWEQARRGLHGPAGMQGVSRFFVFFAVLLGSLMALWTLLAMNWYVRLTENEIAIKPLFGITEQVYPYNRLQQIVLTSHTMVKDQEIASEGLHLKFDDGRTWSTGQSFRVPDVPEQRKRVLELLTEKSSKPLTRAKLIESVPGW